jgi:hypothetical protein
MEGNSMISKFKELFTALELCANIDGKDRRGLDLDEEVSKLSGTNPKTVEKWRWFYNRVKHADLDQKDIDSHYDAERDLPQQLTALRNTVREILLSKLKLF